MYPNNNKHNGYRYERRQGGEYFVSDVSWYFRNSIHKGNTKRMESVKLIFAVLYGIGLMTYIGGILIHFGDWKDWLLFIPGCLFIFARLVVFCVKNYQQIRRENMD